MEQNPIYEDSKSESEYYSIVLGETQHGKDSFILSLDVNNLEKTINENKPMIQLGNNQFSCTSQIYGIPVINDILFRNKQAYMVNTIGFGETSGHYNNQQIVIELLRHLIKQLSKRTCYIDSIFIVQSLENSSTTQLQKILTILNQAFGGEILKSIIIIGSKGNLIQSAQDLNDKIQTLNGIAKQFKLPYDTFDFRGKYKKNGKGGLLGPKQQEMANQIANLREQIERLPQFSLKNFEQEIQQRSKSIQNQLRNDTNYWVQYPQKRIEWKRLWYTLWICKKEVVFYETVLQPQPENQIIDESFEQAISYRFKSY